MTLRLIGWAILHSLWQGGVIALIAAGLLAATRRPLARYMIALISLAAMLIAPIVTATRMMNDASSSPELATILPGPVTPKIDAPATGITPSTLVSMQTAASPATSASRLVETISTSVEPGFKWMIAAWIIGLLISSIRLMGGLARTRRITRNNASITSDALRIRVSKLAERLGINRAIRTIESTSIDVPLVIGAVRPVIVVPVSLLTTLTPMQLDMLLAHELAHIRRYDYVINLIQTVIETLLFYHPAASWISDVAREERENCCDDIAVEACGGSTTEYTTALLALEESRSQGFGLAAAATGGSLLKRARRLITGNTPSLELGPRWIAGVITIGAALFTGNEAFGAIQNSFVVAASTKSHDDSTKSRKIDQSRAAPSSVTKAPVGGSLADRWKWAERNSGSSRTWVGYLVAGDDASEKNRIYVSDIPVYIKDGNVTMSGRINFGDGDLSSFAIAGVPLAPIVGQHAGNSTAIFLQIEGGITGRRVTRVHLGTFALPAYFSRLPLIWLDSADDNESISLLKEQLAATRDEDTRRDLVSAIGVHRNKDVVVPALLAILGSNDVEGVRRVAAEWLGRTNDSRAVSALSRAARSDRADGVRRESIEAFSHMSMPSATDTLIAFSRSLGDYELRRVTIEAIGYRPDDRAFNYLVSVVNGRDDLELRRRAAEAIADMPGQRGASTVIELAQRHPDAEIRRQFVESLARLDPPSRALDLLQRITIADPSEDVRAEAVEAIGEVDDSHAIEVLTNIAHSSTTSRIRREALETLASVADDATAVRLLVDAAKTDPNEEVRRGAMEALGDAKDPRAMAALESLVKSGPTLDARIMALEVYTDAAKPGDAAEILRSIARSDASADMREKARELLADLAKN